MRRRVLRPGAIVGHVLVLVAALVCVRLAVWQWHRAHETTGSIQNLGYAVLWPVFGVAFVYMWVRFLRLEAERDVADDAAVDAFAADVMGATTDDFLAGPRSNPDLTPVPSEDRRTHVGPTESVALPVDPGIPVVAVESDGEPQRDHDAPTQTQLPHRLSRPAAPDRSVTLSVVTVDSDGDDPEMAAYNRVLAELAERDRRRAS